MGNRPGRFGCGMPGTIGFVRPLFYDRLCMNYQNILCVGDSQTFGARSYGCYPLYLAKLLSEKTPYEWRAINQSANGMTARDLWFHLNGIIDTIGDTFQACMLIGANDVGERTDTGLFEEYYRQILRTFSIKKYKAVFCGGIPPIHPGGHIFFTRESVSLRDVFNDVIRKVVAEFAKAHFVALDELDRECFEDPVHLNERGNAKVAELFSETIMKL